MIGSPMKIGVVAAMGLVLLVGQGCSMKWLQSDGKTGEGSAQKGGQERGLCRRKSIGLRIRGLGVQVPPGAPLYPLPAESLRMESLEYQ